MSAPTGSPPGWYADPTGRHQHRYWDGADWTASVSDAAGTATDVLDVQPATAPVGASTGAARRRRSRGRVLAWTFGVLLAVVGVLGFVTAHLYDSQNEDTHADDYAALGRRDAGTETQALNARVNKVNAAYNAYLAATTTVNVRHEAVTDQFNAVVSPLNPFDLLGIQKERAKLPGVIAAYDAAVRRERVALQVYLDQLALLKARAAR